MPYIKQSDRDLFDIDVYPNKPGELNYIFTKIAIQYWNERKNYDAINDIVGALEGAKLEFYRRVAVPYEESKIKENGDVYPI